MMLPSGAGGSIPELVMRTGILRTMDPADAREDIEPDNVSRMVSEATNTDDAYPVFPNTPLPQAQPSPVTAAVAVTAQVEPPKPIIVPTLPPRASSAPYPAMHGWQGSQPRGSFLGEIDGKPVAAFQIAARPTLPGAHSAAGALARAAKMLKDAGYGTLPPEMVGGPLAAIMRGGVAELHFANGITLRTY